MSMDDRTRILPGRIETGVGTQLSGIYELDERIASGGMGEVYRGHNIQTGDLVAIKIVLPELARDQTILSLFRKEASILNHLSHEAIVRYHVFTVDPAIGRPYLAMEYVDGPSLFDIIREGPMTPDDVRRLCHRLASGLSAVHRAGAIHRDLSPDNVILPGGRVERAKIIDFGIARSAHVGGETLIGGRFAGKYNYVSPEQLGLHGGEVSERSDIYSLGLVLAAALRGRPLDMTGSQVDVVEKRRSVPDLTGVEGEMRPVIEAMLQPDPNDRPASMAEIVRLSRTTSQVAPDEESQAAEQEEEWDEETRATKPWKGIGRTQSSGEGEQKAGTRPFVEHVRPSHLSRQRPKPVAHPPPSIRRRSGAVIAGLVLIVLAAAGAGLYFAAHPPWAFVPGAPEEQAMLAPEHPAPRQEAASAEPAVAPAPGAASRKLPEEAKPATQAHRAAPEPKANAVIPGTPLPASESVKQLLEQSRATSIGTGPAIAQPAATPAEPANPATPLAGPRQNGATAPAASPPSEAAPSSKPVAAASETAPPSKAGSPEAAGGSRSKPAIATQRPVPAKQASMPADAKPQPPEAAAAAIGTSQPTQTAQSAPESDVPAAAPPSLKPRAENDVAETSVKEKQAPSQPGTGAEHKNSPVRQPVHPATEAAAPNEPNTAKESGAVVAMNLPRPAAPPPQTGTLEKTVSWLRAFPGGDCFYATPADTGKEPVTIVGFGTTPEPFAKLAKAFGKEFGSEPDVQVRLIAPAQCALTRFMRGFGMPAKENQTLTLDRTSVPNGSPISGVLKTRGGLHSNLLLIDHDGMTYNLDRLLIVEGDIAKFNARIQLDPASRQKGKPMPEIVLAITGAVDIKSASMAQPAPAYTVLPKIQEEIGQSGADFSVTAKYFQLGG